MENPSINCPCLLCLKDNIELFESFSEIDALVKSVPDNGDVYFVPAFSGLFAPHWDSEARGIICGITEETQRGHIVRAALESVCFQVCTELHQNFFGKSLF